VTGSIEVDVRYERLSQGTRGAFVIRTADGMPHQVTLADARLIPGGEAEPAGEGHPLRVDPIVLDVQPGQDMIIPFDIRTGEVPRGMYAVRATVTVDGGPAPDAVQGEIRVR
jgi:hypothetical protein